VDQFEYEILKKLFNELYEDKMSAGIYKNIQEVVK
jgi:hypothetical protein